MSTYRTSPHLAALCCAAAFAFAATGCGQKTKGDPGTNGSNGANGTSCAVTDNHDGTSTIKCTDGTSATVASGAQGTAGTSCSVHDNGNGTATISCSDGTTATVANGANGTSCIVTNNNNGTRTITCGNGSSVTVPDATVDYNILTLDEVKVANLQTVITGVSVPADGKPVVNLKVSERHGYGVRGLAALASGSTTSLAVSWRFALLKLVPGNAPPTGAATLGVNGSANDTWVSYMGSSATATTSTETAVAVATASSGALTDNGDGTYTYKFAKQVTAGATAGTTYDAAANHRLVILISQSNNPFAPMDLVRDFIPSTGADVTGQNEKVDPAACLECHTAFRALPDGTGVLSAGEFHGGARYDVRTCVACHNDQRRFQTFAAPVVGAEVDDSSVAWAAGCGALPAQCKDRVWTGNLAKVNGEAVINLPVWIHKIHMGEKLSLAGTADATGKVTQGYAGLGLLEATYPQDIRNCQKCHRNPAGSPAPQANNWKAKPSRRACNACHDGVSFAATVPAGRVPHGGGAQADDSKCAQCHSSDDTDINGVPQHLAVLPPDPAATWFTGGTNANTNAAYIAATGVVPPGAKVPTYVVNSVGVDANLHPQIVFKIQIDGADAAFSPQPAASTATQELIAGGIFVGGPSAYFVWSVPQDGIAKPADFNMSASGYIRNINNKSATGTISGPATVGSVTGLYTLTLTGTTLTSNASMLQGGVGYTYALSGTQPLTQVNLNTIYPTAPSATAPGFLTGGLIVPAPDQWKTATGCVATPVDTTALCVARRGVSSSAPSTASVVSNAKCNGCHVALGVGPTFHAGQRNDSPTCAFCHKPNQTSSGWSANAKDFIHGIHASGKRSVAFNWHAVGPGANYADVTYPGILNHCEMCHNAGTYDFSAATTIAALPNMLPSTVATGTFDARPATNPTGYYSISPYVQDPNNFAPNPTTNPPAQQYSLTNYGYGYSTSNVSFTLPDAVGSGGLGQSGFDLNGVAVANCTLATPCVCTTSKPCTVTLPGSGQATVQNVTKVFSMTTTAATPVDCSASVCTCTTNKTATTGPCSATLATCSPAAPCNAQPTTLVKSPIVSACSACHDSDMAIDHMRTNGGTFYEPRSVLATRDEECLICHGPNRLASIALVHQDKTP